MSNLLSFFKNHPGISFLLGAQFFRLLLLPFMGLMPQDAYYYLYGQNLSFSYFDHPGMIGYILRLFSEVFGQSVFTVKFTDFTITSLTILSFYKLAGYFLAKQKVERALILICSTLFISILSFNSTPDVPLLLFWTLSLIGLYKAIFEQKKAYWILAGIAIGLAFNSKYTALLLPVGLLGFLAFSNRYRKLFISPWLWVCLFTIVVISFPVWWWNYQNDFASFLFQSSNRTGSISKFKVSPLFFFGAIGHQTLLLLPVLCYVFFVLVYKYTKKILFRRKLVHSKTLFLLAFFIPTFIGFFAISPIYWVKLNWMMPSYITGIIIAAMLIGKNGIKGQIILAVCIHIFVSIQVIYYIVPIKSDDTWLGWEELAHETNLLQKKYPNSFVFSNDNYKTSACLNFFMNQKVYAQNVIGLPALHFDYLGDDLSILKDKNAIFIDSDTRFKNNAKKGKINPLLTKYFEKVTELKPIIIQKEGKEIRKFWIFYCENYRE